MENVKMEGRVVPNVSIIAAINGCEFERERSDLGGLGGIVSSLDEVTDFPSQVSLCPSSVLRSAYIETSMMLTLLVLFVSCLASIFALAGSAWATPRVSLPDANVALARSAAVIHTEQEHAALALQKILSDFGKKQRERGQLEADSDIDTVTEIGISIAIRCEDRRATAHATLLGRQWRIANERFRSDARCADGDVVLGLPAVPDRAPTVGASISFPGTPLPFDKALHSGNLLDLRIGNVVAKHRGVRQSDCHDGINLSFQEPSLIQTGSDRERYTLDKEDGWRKL